MDGVRPGRVLFSAQPCLELDRMRNAITWVDETHITDRLIGQGEVTALMIQRMAD